MFEVAINRYKNKEIIKKQTIKQKNDQKFLFYIHFMIETVYSRETRKV